MAKDYPFKTRFCPSPTGLMHLGNLRTCLFNVLLAKAEGQHGVAGLLLRIEDTDSARSKAEYVTALMRDLHWLTLGWQEGPEREGKHGAYYQSHRMPLYEKYYQQLLDAKQAYWCYCSELELSIVRKNQINAGLPPRYPGTCRHLTEAQLEAKKAKGVAPALRFQIPDNEVIEFNDFIQGAKHFETSDLGDFIIKKADGTPSFMFCNAVDDALMEVTHVMRGEDHLTNTPRQLLILKALGLMPPQYGHMALIIGFDGKPLSKRNGSQSVESLREQGYFPLAVLNYLARLGHHFESTALLSLEELGAHFRIDHISRSPARFDLIQLHHWQKECVLSQTLEALHIWLEATLQEVEKEKRTAFVETVKNNIVLPKDAQFWAQQLLSNDAYDYDEAACAALHEAGPVMLEAIEQALQAQGEDYQGVVQHILHVTKRKGKAVFLPLRAALTGRCFGPELPKIFSLMGKQLLLQRIQTARAQLLEEDRAGRVK